ncbi:sigma 54-interacting transcriptional regulator [Myxococcota bacterium]|nr:sigma 54-interacting transcriptional regulator [Myxococcota bacterium]MBU1431709.1 sigma 54-interacting transcriptional regulator [Myxococcota bacterium]MBU1900707.1 sigma 54-interacting transcriptional regulator [Myxococcota bacterium]
MSEVTRTQIGVGVDRLTTRAYTLEIIQGPDQGRTLSTRARVVVLGASPDCDLELDDPLVSRRHARIEVDPRGHRLIDEESKNGLFIGNLRVSDVYLAAGTTFMVGQDLIRYQPGEEVVEIALSREAQFGRMLGRSAAMREIFAILARVAPTSMSVLVEGESGTGKELVAEAIHAHSKRAQAPLIVFDCSAVAPNLIESELFGHVKGAFTGASQSRKGAFEQAHGGTLFLDEIGELPLDLQPKLLRALEQGEVRPVGGERPIKVDVRIIAATNRDLQREVEAKQFRQDLFYRLAVLRLVLPPLRRRIEDLPLLVRHFLDALETEAPVQVGYETIIKLQRHRWPGNIRELRNFVERAAMLSREDRLETRYLLPPSFGDAPTTDDAAPAPPSEIDVTLPFKDAKARLIEGFERRYWSALLKETGGNISAAARRAGIHRKSAEYLLKKLELDR